MNDVFVSDPQSERLTRLVETGKVIVFVGSGLSTGLYPAWYELVLELCDACGVTPKVALNRETSVDVLTDLAGDAQKADEKRYLDVLENRFAKGITVQKKAYQLLMGIPFCSYVTINFDPLLADEKNSRAEYCDIQLMAYPKVFTRYLGSRNLFYIHGYIRPGHRPTRDSIVLSRDAFRKAYLVPGNDLGTFWDVLLTEYCVLFIACGLREPEIQLALKRSHARRKRMTCVHDIEPPPLFILRPAFFMRDDALGIRERDSVREKQEQAEFESFGISIVRYDKKDQEHVGLLEVLESWNPPLAINDYSPEKEAWCQV